MQSIYDLLELFTETVTMNKNKRRSVLTTKEPSVASQDEAALSPALAHDPFGRKLGQVDSVISQDSQPARQFAYHTVGEKARGRYSRTR